MSVPLPLSLLTKWATKIPLHSERGSCRSYKSLALPVLTPIRGASDSLEGGLDGEIVGGDDVGVGIAAAVGVDRPGEEVGEDPQALGLGPVTFSVVAGLPLGAIRDRGEFSLASGPIRGDDFVGATLGTRWGFGTMRLLRLAWSSLANEFLAYPQMVGKSQEFHTVGSGQWCSGRWAEEEGFLTAHCLTPLGETLSESSNRGVRGLALARGLGEEGGGALLDLGGGGLLLGEVGLEDGQQLGRTGGLDGRDRASGRS